MVPRPQFGGFMNLAQTGAGPVRYPKNVSVLGYSSETSESCFHEFDGDGPPLIDIGAGPVRVMAPWTPLCQIPSC